MTQPTRPPAWPGSGRSPGPPILNLWIPVSRSTPPSTPPSPPIPSDASVLAIDRDVEKSPRTPAHATHSYAVNDHAGPSAWLARVARRGGGGAGVVKRFLAAGLLLVVLVVLIAKSTDSISTVRKWTGTNSVGASAHSEAVLSPEPVPPPPPPHPPKPPARPTGDLRPIDIASDAMPLDATTEERLAMWESSPGGRGDVDGEVEMGDFVRWNLEQCEDTWPNHNNEWVLSLSFIGSVLLRSLTLSFTCSLMRKAANTWGTLNRVRRNSCLLKRSSSDPPLASALRSVVHPRPPIGPHQRRSTGRPRWRARAGRFRSWDRLHGRCISHQRVCTPLDCLTPLPYLIR